MTHSVIRQSDSGPPMFAFIERPTLQVFADRGLRHLQLELAGSQARSTASGEFAVTLTPATSAIGSITSKDEAIAGL